jgi:hypothetical protein
VEEVEVELVVVYGAALARIGGTVRVQCLFLRILLHLLLLFLNFVSDLGEQAVPDIFECLYVQANLTNRTIDH